MVTPPDAIVVGVDSSADSDRAVRWAMRLGARTRQPVHLVHVQPEAPAQVTDEWSRRRWADAGRLVLDAALLEAERTAAVPLSSQSLEDVRTSITEALVNVSRDAAMLVLGARGHGGYSGLLTGSVSQHAARHAKCPVVTVREPHTPEGHVVVGVDESAGAERALELALQLASDLRVDLVVIHAWRAPALHGAGVLLPMPTSTPQAIEAQELALADRVRPWREKHPRLRVLTEVVPGHAAAVLTDASDHASVVVVGSRGRGAFADLLLGSVTQSVLHHARCPVAVAR